MHCKQLPLHKSPFQNKQKKKRSPRLTSPPSLAYLYLVFTDPGYNRNGDFTPVVVAYAFLIGLQITNCFTTPLSSGIDTIFVAAAWDPEALMREHPELYQRMVKVYPHVQTAIHA